MQDLKFKIAQVPKYHNYNTIITKSRSYAKNQYVLTIYDRKNEEEIYTVVHYQGPERS